MGLSQVWGLGSLGPEWPAQQQRRELGRGALRVSEGWGAEERRGAGLLF